MTIVARNKMKLLTLSVSLSLAIFALFSYVYSLLSHAYVVPLEWLLQFVEVPSVYSRFTLEYSPLAVSTVALFFAITSSVSLIYTYFAFRKIQSTEIVFFELFLFSLSWEALRLLVPYFGFSSIIMAELSSISRLLYFFKFMSIFSLLGMALFATVNVTRQKTFIVASFIFISLMLSMSSPLDCSQVNYLFLAGQPFIQGYVTLVLASSVCLVLTVVCYYLYERLQERFYMIGSSISVVIGYVVLLFSGDYWTLTFGMFFFLYGEANIIKNIRSTYLWK